MRRRQKPISSMIICKVMVIIMMMVIIIHDDAFTFGLVSPEEDLRIPFFGRDCVELPLELGLMGKKTTTFWKMDRDVLPLPTFRALST